MYAPAEFVYDIAQLVHQQQLAPLRIVAGAVRVRSVITSVAGDSAPTRGGCGCSGRRKPAFAPSSRVGSGW